MSVSPTGVKIIGKVKQTNKEKTFSLLYWNEFLRRAKNPHDKLTGYSELTKSMSFNSIFSVIHFFYFVIDVSTFTPLRALYTYTHTNNYANYYSEVIKLPVGNSVVFESTEENIFFSLYFMTSSHNVCFCTNWKWFLDVSQMRFFPLLLTNC